MKMTVPIFAAILVLGLLPGTLRAEGGHYTIQDLQALEKRKDWNELYMHMEDVPPGRRDGAWDRLAVRLCLQEEFQQDYMEEWCASRLRSISGAAPNDRELAWRAGKWARLHRAHWFAAPFFDAAIAKSGDLRCRDEDVSLAVTAALGLPADSHGEYVRHGSGLAFRKCWTEMKPSLMKKLSEDGGGYFRDNTCRELMGRNVLSPGEAKICAGVK